MPDDNIPPHVKAQADNAMQNSTLDRQQTAASMQSYTEGQGVDNAARLQVIKEAELQQEQAQKQEQQPQQPEH